MEMPSVESQSSDVAESPELLVNLGDAAELTLGDGRSTNENKRHIYN